MVAVIVPGKPAQIGFDDCANATGKGICMHAAAFTKAGIKIGIRLNILVLWMLTGPIIYAQSTNQPEDETPDGTAVAETDTDPAEPVRAVGSEQQAQRLRDVGSEDEYEIELTVPPAAFGLSPGQSLPDHEQNQVLYALLEKIASEPDNAATRAELSQLLDNILAQANEHIDAVELTQAEIILDVVKAIDPDRQGLEAARNRISELGAIEGALAAAESSMKAGRVYDPRNNSAWYFYRLVLDQDPENVPAQQGLLAVQRDMISRALEYARELDFDSAERMLEDAEYVREPKDLVTEARQEIRSFRTLRAQELEVAAVTAMDAGDFDRAERVLIDLIALGGADQIANQLRRRMEEARIYGGFQPGQVIRDHFLNRALWTPESVVIASGSYLMGSSAFEAGRADNEGPQHRVTFRRGFAIGRQEVTVDEFNKFTRLTGYQTDAERVGSSTIYDHFSGRLTERDDMDWEMNYEGRRASPNDPVVHISWNDAQAYVRWLARGTGKSYRLPTEAEFEYAQRGGASGLYWWGDGSPGRIVENLTGANDISRSRRQWSDSFRSYKDEYWGPAPVASFAPNPYGIFDIAGNVAEWVGDCWHDTYIRAPSDGMAWINPGCSHRVIRGGYWASSPKHTRSAFRLKAQPDSHDARVGFRIARDL
jgi:formylglycine-generating enzyme required for sulfatase activity